MPGMGEKTVTHQNGRHNCSSCCTVYSEIIAVRGTGSGRALSHTQYLHGMGLCLPPFPWNVARLARHVSTSASISVTRHVIIVLSPLASLMSPGPGLNSPKQPTLSQSPPMLTVDRFFCKPPSRPFCALPNVSTHRKRSTSSTE